MDSPSTAVMLEEAEAILASNPPRRVSDRRFNSGLKPTPAYEGIPPGDVTSYRQPTIRALRSTHHRLAKLLSGGGVQITTAARLCGYSPSRVQQLSVDPAFQELVAHYKEEVDEEWREFVAAASDLSLDFLQLLQERLDENPDTFTAGMALEAIKTLADRSGNAPVSRSVNVNVVADFGDRLNRAKARQAALESSAPFEAQPAPRNERGTED